MQLILYPLIIFVIVFLVQLLFIIKKAENNTSIKIVINLLIALIVSAIIGIISFYVFGLLVLVGLREGH